MKKRYIVMIGIIIYMIIGIKANAEEYNRTIDYRYNLRGYKDYYFNSDYTDWYTERETTFTDRNTDNFIFTRESGSTTKAVTTTSVINGQDGTFYWSSSVVSGWSGSPPYLGHLYVDYIYTSPTSTVDTNYTISFTGEKHGTTTDATYYNRGTFTVELLGISRLDSSSYSTIKTISYVNNPDTDDEYNYGETVTITGDDGYNYSGYVLRVHIYCVSAPYTYPCNGNTYKIYTLTNSLDNFTPEIDYTDQLNNINGTLGSIYNAIQSIPSYIQALPNTIITGIRNLFIYDDWREDIDDIVSDIEVPFVDDITNAFSSIISTISTYNPYYRERISLPNYITDNPEYILQIDLDISSILGGEAFGGYTWIELIRLGNNFAIFGMYYALIRKLLLKIGIDINDYISPIIRRITNI